MNKLLIDEDVLDALIEKALPQEYEVLMEGYNLSEDEEELLYLLLLLFSDILEKTKLWVYSLDSLSIDDLDMFFFDDMRSEINELFKKHFIPISALLEIYYDDGKSLAYSDLNVTPVDFGNDKTALSIIKHHNHQKIGEIIDGICNNMRDSIWDGVKDGLAIGELIPILENNAFNPVGKFTPQQRAEMIAITERSRAFNTGKLQTYMNYGVQLVDVVTMHDERVCQTCIDVENNNPYTIQEAEELLPLHPRCYDKETSVFTKDGWKLFKDVTIDDEFLSLDPETLETEFLKPIDIVSYHNTEDMVHIYNKWFDCCVTQDHDCFVLKRKSIDNVRQYVPEFRKPHELNSECNFLRTVNYTGGAKKDIDVNGLTFKSSDFAFLMAWYLSEGNVLHNQNTAKSKDYPIKITQVKENNRKILEKELVRICDYLNIKLYIGKDYFELHSKELYDYFLPLGYSHEKYIPKEVYGLCKEDLIIFIDNYVLGDGSCRTVETKYGFVAKERSIASSSKRLIDGLSYICLLIGYNPSMSISRHKGSLINDNKKGKTYTINHDVYSIRLNKSKKNGYETMTTELMPYDDMVYCVELPKYHTLWVQRNGQAHWNGNCRCIYKPHYDENYVVSQFLPQDYVVDLTNY